MHSNEVLSKLFGSFANRPCLGERSRNGNILLDSYSYLNFNQVWQLIQDTANGIKALKIANTREFVGICGYGSIEYCTTFLACNYLNLCSVPLQTTLPASDLSFIFKETELTLVVCSLEQLDNMVAVMSLDTARVRTVCIMDVPWDENGQCAQLHDSIRRVSQLFPRIRFLPLRDVYNAGRQVRTQSPADFVSYTHPQPDDLMTLLYTSGTTGFPKGAMFPEKQWVSEFDMKGAAAGSLVVYTFLPMAHRAGRNNFTSTIARGGSLAFIAKSDMSSLFDDIRLVRPTSFTLIPKVASSIYHHYRSEVLKRVKLAGLAGSDRKSVERIEEEVRKEMSKTFLGDRLKSIVLTTAPTSPEIYAFLKSCFQVPIRDVYGATENGSVLHQNKITNRVVAYKLVDVPELGYFTTDKPFPRGELRVKSTTLIPGYFKNPNASRALFDDEGFMCTGDVMEQRGPDEFHYIDRKSNVLKLSQGEFVGTARLEALFSSKSPFIFQIYLYGNSLQSFLLAVIVPRIDTVREHLLHHQQPVSESAVKSLIRSELVRVAQQESLKPYEVPRDFIIELDPFSKENTLLTESNKPMRPKLKKKYGEALERLYAEITRHQESKRSQLPKIKDIVERVSTAIQLELNLAPEDFAQFASTKSFTDLRGDSIAGQNLAAVILESCDVSVPVSFLLDRTIPILQVVRYVENVSKGLQQSLAAGQQIFDAVHGADAQAINATDLRLENFLSPADLQRASALKDVPTSAEVRCVLITGANGFLGRFLLLQLLDRLPPQATVVAIVRAGTDAIAYTRLEDEFRTTPALLSKFQSLSQKPRLTVLSGDLSKPFFGLSQSVYAKLSESVDCVLHNGALVNHMFTYRQMFEPNVLGTVEVMRFAVTGRKKRISFSSSVAAAQGALKLGLLQKSGATTVLETHTARDLFSRRPNGGGYAVGYGTSKWACELLLQNLSERFGVVVNIFRCSMILAHSAGCNSPPGVAVDLWQTFMGQINKADFFTRLLVGIVYTNLAPSSFYISDAKQKESYNFDGTPVDFVSQMIAGITVGALSSQSLSIYHVVNPHYSEDVSLDKIVRWISSFGYPIKLVQSYPLWFQQFTAQLTALPDSQRRQSPFPILYQWERARKGEQDAPFDAVRFRSMVPKLFESPVPMQDVPRLTEQFIHRNLQHLIALKIIPPSPAQSSPKSAL